MVRTSVNNSCCCIWRYDCDHCTKIYSCYLFPFFLDNVHNTCYNYTCICPRMQKCILRGPNYKILPGGACSCTPTPRSCLWIDLYPHCLLLKCCRLFRFLLKTLAVCIKYIILTLNYMYMYMYVLVLCQEQVCTESYQGQLQIQCTDSASHPFQ